MTENTPAPSDFNRQSFRIERPRLPPELDVRVAGKEYQFKFEPRCKVCKAGDEIRTVINKLLVQGLTYQDVFNFVDTSYNKVLEKKDKISYSSIRTHQKLHLPFESAAIREIIERRAQQAQKDFIEGTETLITPATYAEVMMNRAFSSLVSPSAVVDPEAGLAAAKTLHSFIKDEEGTVDAAIALQQLNKIIMAVRTVCTEEQMSQILAILDGQQSIAGEVVEDFDPGVDDDDFDPDDTEDDRGY